MQKDLKISPYNFNILHALNWIYPKSPNVKKTNQISLKALH